MKRIVAFMLAAILGAGCTQAPPPPEKGPVAKVADLDNTKYVLPNEPADAKNVIDVKKDAKDGQEVVVVGRIGGSKQPFTSGRVSFMIADVSFVPCTERAEPEESDAPWEFC